MNTHEIPYGYCKCGCGQKTPIAKVTRSNRGWFRGEPIPYIQTHHAPTYGTPEERFWQYVDRNTPNGCWVWTKQLSKAGYGILSVNGTGIYTHRFSYELHYGPIPEGMYICHHCDNPACCNPAHLFLGTHQDNVDDMRSKGRGANPPRPQGSQHHMAKLNEKQVTEIRELAAKGEKRRELARTYGVSHTMICQIINRKNWIHIP